MNAPSSSLPRKNRCVDADSILFEACVLREVQRLFGVLSELVNTPVLEGIIGTDIVSVDKQHFSIAINSVLIDGLVFFAKVDSGLSASTKEELMMIGIRKKELMSAYESQLSDTPMTIN